MRTPYRPALAAATAAAVAVLAAAAWLAGEEDVLLLSVSVLSALAALAVGVAAARYARGVAAARLLGMVACFVAVATLVFWLFLLFVAFQPR